jgi:hypothetical protein
MVSSTLPVGEKDRLRLVAPIDIQQAGRFEKAKAMAKEKGKRTLQQVP